MKSAKRKPRVAWVAIQPTPYVLPLFDVLHRNEELEAHFFFSSIKSQQPWSIDRYEQLIAPESRRRTFGVGQYTLNPCVVRAIARKPWDAVIVAGYAFPTMQASILTCIVRRIPFILQADTQLLKHRSLLKRALKRAILFPVLRQCSAAVGLGIEAQRYWQHVGVPPERTLIVPFTPHLDHFRSQSIKAAPERPKIRDNLGIARDALVGIFVGRLIDDKALDVLLRALAKVPPQRRPHLLLVGEGPEKERLQRIAHRHSLPVSFLGFRQNDELPALYAASDFFVLSSRREAWGVVVSEAMASGLPVVLSDQVGAASDLLEEGRNGFLVPSESVDAWHDALLRCEGARHQMKEMGERSRALVGGWTCEQSAKQVLAALQIAIRNRPSDSIDLCFRSTLR